MDIMSYEGDNKQNDGHFYSDDMSRKVVGKLYDSAEDTPDTDGYDSTDRKETPINNRFYEESRASRADDEDSIVVGFKDEDSYDEDEYTRPSRARQKMDEAYDSDKEERDKYRRQFLNSYTDVRRKGLEGPVGSQTRKRPKVNGENKFDEAVRQETPIRKTGAAPKTPRDYQVQNTPEKRTSRRNTPSDYSEKNTRQSPQKDRSSYGYSNNSSNYSNIMDLFQLPIIKIAAAVFAVMFIITITQSVRLGGANKKIKAFEEAEAAVQEEVQNAENYEIEISGLKEQIKDLKDDKNGLETTVAELKTEIERLGTSATSPTTPSENSGTQTSAGGTRSYTVKSGDSLSRISQEFYGSSSTANIDKIKSANNMTSDNISIGQVLVIPE